MANKNKWYLIHFEPFVSEEGPAYIMSKPTGPTFNFIKRCEATYEELSKTYEEEQKRYSKKYREKDDPL